jgi:prevent-host-death family protein
VTVHAAKTHLSRLLEKVQAGEEIVIARGKTPVAKLTAVEPARKRRLGTSKGQIRIADDFDAPLPDMADYER